MTTEEILVDINKYVRIEHGKKVDIDSKLSDSEMDSFGFTMVIMELHEKYKCFDTEWFNANVGKELAVATLVERISNASK